MEGSILCYADLWLAWAPRSLTQVTMDTLTLVDLAKPVPDLVVLGTGRRIQPPPRELAAALEERGVSIEAVDTINAVATFNILNQEGRKVVGAMLPANAD